MKGGEILIEHNNNEVWQQCNSQLCIGIRCMLEQWTNDQWLKLSTIIDRRL